MLKASNIFVVLFLAATVAQAQVKPDPRVLTGQAGAVADDLLKWDGAKWAPARADVSVVADSAAFRAYSGSGNKMVVMTDSLRGGKFRRCYSCSVDQYMVFSDAAGRKWERFDFGSTVSVTWYGARPNDEIHDSIGIQKAFASPYNVWFPAGNFYGSTHLITSPKTIFGNGATITQRSQLSSQARIITVFSDNVTIQDMNLVGQIATQTGEFSHGICVGKTISDVTATGVKNIVLRNISISGVRGDGIMIVASGLAIPYYCENVIADNIVIDNAFRNGISVISGKKCRFSNLRMTRIGLWGFDLEPDIATQTGEEIVLEDYWGPGVAFGHHAALNQNISFSNFYCDGARQGSSPTYSSNPLFLVGVNIRQTSNLTVSKGIVRRFGGYGLEIGQTTVAFRNVRIEQVKFDSTTYDSYFSNSKMIDQYDSASDSAFTFESCQFDGRGVLAQVGFPAGSIVRNCKFTRFDRLLLSHRGKMYFEGCDIDCYNDLIYASSGGSTFEGCNIMCTYLVRGEDVEGNLYTWRNCTISAVTPYYNFFGGSPNTRFVWLNNTLNSAVAQTVANGETLFGTHGIVTGSSLATITLPKVFKHPYNRIVLDNATDGRAVTIDPEGSDLVVGSATYTTTTNAILTNNGTAWYTYKGSTGSADGNGIYSGSGTVPNNTVSTLTNDFTFAGTDGTGTQTPAFRVTASGTDPGVQTWATASGLDSVMLYFLDSEPFLQGYGGDFWVSSGSDDLRLSGSSIVHHTGKTILQGLLAVPHITCAADITLTEATEEVDAVGHTAAFTITLDYTSNLLGTSSRTVTVRNRSATYSVNLARGSQTWMWALLDGTTTSANQTIAPGEAALLTWDDALTTDYYIFQKIPAGSGGGSTGETIISPAQLTAAADNWNPTGLSTASIIRLSGDNQFRIISGIQAPATPKELTLTNVGTDFPILITREDAASSAANRFAVPKDIALYPNYSATFYYDATSSRWRLRNLSGDMEVLAGKQFGGTFLSTGSVTTGDYDIWTITTSTGSVGTNGPAATLPRLLLLSTGSSATAAPSITTKAASIWTGTGTSATSAYYRTIIGGLSALSDGTDTYTLIAGLTGNTSAFTASPDGAFFRYSHGINSGKWQAVTSAAAVSTTFDTGVTFAASTNYTLEVFYRPDQSASFFVNGTYITEITTNVWSGYSYPFITIIKSAGTTSRSVNVHAIQYLESRQ